MCFCCDNECDEPFLTKVDKVNYKLLATCPITRFSRLSAPTERQYKCPDFRWECDKASFKSSNIVPRTGAERLRDEEARLRCPEYLSYLAKVEPERLAWLKLGV